MVAQAQVELWESNAPSYNKDKSRTQCRSIQETTLRNSFHPLRFSSLVHLLSSLKSLGRPSTTCGGSGWPECQVADFEIPLRQHVEQESTDEFKDLKRGLLQLTAFAIVFPLKVNSAIFNLFEPVIGNRHPLGVAAEIFQYLFRAAKGPFAKRHPGFTVKLILKLVKLSRVLQIRHMPF